MFQIDMKEKYAEEVEIKDVKPEHFEDFLAAISPQRVHPNRLFYVVLIFRINAPFIPALHLRLMLCLPLTSLPNAQAKLRWDYIPPIHNVSIFNLILRDWREEHGSLF